MQLVAALKVVTLPVEEKRVVPAPVPDSGMMAKDGQEHNYDLALHPVPAQEEDAMELGTSKAGLSHESWIDPIVTANSEGSNLKKIVPNASLSSSSDSSPKHKEAAGHFDSLDEICDLPGNTRSVTNRGLKAQLESASFPLHKKAKLSEDLNSSSNYEQLSTSPDLHHKVSSAASRKQQGDDSDGGVVHTNMFGVNYVMWFDLSIEGKSPMDPEEEDWGGKVEFGFGDKNFPKDLEDYFLLMEDECTTQTHSCAGRVMGVLFNMREQVLKPPSYDPRNVVDLLDKYRDAHIVDSGWREVDNEEWVA